MVFNNTPKSHVGSIFSPVRTFTPAVAVEVIDDDGEIYTEMEPVEPKSKKKVNRYLPGERLLLKLHKQKLKEREKKQLSRTDNVKTQEIDVDQISRSVSKLLSSF